MLEADVFRQFGATGTARLLKLYARDRGFRPIVTLRLFQRTRGTALGRVLYPLLWLWHRRSTRRAGMDVGLRTPVGPGLMIAHSYGIVINEQARIGANVTLFHGVTLGRGDRIDRDGDRSAGGAPVIEDEVWLGPNVAVVGGVTIGRGSRLLANSFVTESVAPYSMVAGNPARVLREDCAPDVLNRAVV